MTEANAELLEIFKAFADANRLKIIGLLARQPYSVEQLAALLDLKPPTVSHHLSRLSEVRLVGAKAEGYYSMYYLDESALKKTRLLFSRRPLGSVAMWIGCLRPQGGQGLSRPNAG
jgi:DNA-binding transcriptional ArsR family regulator